MKHLEPVEFAVMLAIAALLVVSLVMDCRRASSSAPPAPAVVPPVVHQVDGGLLRPTWCLPDGGECCVGYSCWPSSGGGLR